jgi:acetaldehyde dehydrogenase (acetylating)
VGTQVEMEKMVQVVVVVVPVQPATVVVKAVPVSLSSGTRYNLDGFTNGIR